MTRWRASTVLLWIFAVFAFVETPLGPAATSMRYDRDALDRQLRAGDLPARIATAAEDRTRAEGSELHRAALVEPGGEDGDPGIFATGEMALATIPVSVRAPNVVSLHDDANPSSYLARAPPIL